MEVNAAEMQQRRSRKRSLGLGRRVSCAARLESLLRTNGISGQQWIVAQFQNCLFKCLDAVVVCHRTSRDREIRGCLVYSMARTYFLFA